MVENGSFLLFNFVEEQTMRDNDLLRKPILDFVLDSWWFMFGFDEDGICGDGMRGLTSFE